jgi:electron transfer flavoprotein beta subunit
MMNILVCISRVPDTATKIIISGDGKNIDTQGVKYIVNPYDEFAIEEGLRLREKNGGSVIALTVGGEIAKDVLRQAFAMGVDKTVLIKTDSQFDSFFVANNIAEYAKSLNPDLILMGRQSIDFDSLQVPNMLGELLSLPSVSVVSKLTIDGTKVTAERDVEGGKEVLETTLPCIISCQKGLNEPRYPKLPDIMKAKSKPIEEKPAVASESRIAVTGMEIPMKKRIGKILTDSDSDIQELVRLLHEEAKVI